MIVLLSLLLQPSLPARANYLSYVDDKGTKHVVENASEIPEKYRSMAKKTTAGNKAHSPATSDGTSTSTASGTGAAAPTPPAAPGQPATR